MPAPPDQIADAVDQVRQRAIKRYAIQLGAVIPVLGIVAGILSAPRMATTPRRDRRSTIRR
ncbi:MAG: hypothetical protein ABI384_03995 [Allobranchiibius sp.]